MKLLHKTTGLSDHEWIRLSIDEARTDPVGLWQIVRVGREGFGLDDTRLDEFVRNCIFQMIKSGAEPVIGDKGAPYGWSPLFQDGSDPQDVVDAIFHDWKKVAVDPDVDGVWFAFPSVWK